MSLLTLSELWAEVPDAKSDRELFDMAAGLHRTIEKLTNRSIAMRASSAVSAAGVATVKVARHGLPVGSRVSLNSQTNPDAWNGVFEITTVSCMDEFTVVIEAPVEGEDPPPNLTHEGELTVRPVIDAVVPTTGGFTLFLDPRPVAEVLSVELGKSDGTFEAAIDAADYGLSEVRGGVSTTGELVLFDARFPMRGGVVRRDFMRDIPASNRTNYRDGITMQRGARLSYVSGEPVVPADLIYAAMKLVKSIRKRAKNGDMKSQSYDYYSYTRMTFDELKELTGEAESIIASYRLPVI